MSNSKIVTYDLRAPGRNYDDLYEMIKAYSKWAHLTESTWFISSPDSCETIRNNLRSVMDSNDRIFVGELNGTAAWSNLLCKSEYLKNNI